MIKTFKIENKVNIDLVYPTGGKKISFSELKVTFDPTKYNRKKTPLLETEIEDLWTKTIEKNKKLFNETKFRLSDCHVPEEQKQQQAAPIKVEQLHRKGDEHMQRNYYRIKEEHSLHELEEPIPAKHENNQIIWLKIGVTTYKDHCCTNLSSRRDIWQLKGREDYRNQSAFMAQTLGSGIILLTLDDHVLVNVRSDWTGEAGGKVSRPGGHPEPSRVFTVKDMGNMGDLDEIMDDFAKKRGLTYSLETHEDLLHQLNHAIKCEIWDNIQHEVEEELGIARSHLKDLCITGVTYDNMLARRCNIEFFSRLDITSDEAMRMYLRGEQSEAEESTEIKFLSADVIELMFLLLDLKVDLKQDLDALKKSSDPRIEEVWKHQQEDVKSGLSILHRASPSLIGALMLARRFISSR